MVRSNQAPTVLHQTGWTRPQGGHRRRDQHRDRWGGRRNEKNGLQSGRPIGQPSGHRIGANFFNFLHLFRLPRWRQSWSALPVPVQEESGSGSFPERNDFDCVSVDVTVWPVKIAQCLYKLPKMISQVKWKISTTLQKLPKNVDDLGKIIVTTGFEKLPKAQ